MKADIHPEYVPSHVRCTCGNEFWTRSTKPELHVEICSNCHPFYTGRQKLVDTGGRVERFRRRAARSRQAAKACTRAQLRARAARSHHACVPAPDSRSDGRRPRGGGVGCRRAGAPPASVRVASCSVERALGRLLRAHEAGGRRRPHGPALHPARADRRGGRQRREGAGPAALALVEAGRALASRYRQGVRNLAENADLPGQGRLPLVLADGAEVAARAAPLALAAASSWRCRTSSRSSRAMRPTKVPGVMRYEALVSNTGGRGVAAVRRAAHRGRRRGGHRVALVGSRRRAAHRRDPRARVQPARARRGGPREGDRRDLRGRQRARARPALSALSR